MNIMYINSTMDFSYRPQFTLSESDNAVENIKYEEIYLEEIEYKINIIYVRIENECPVVGYLLHLPFT